MRMTHIHNYFDEAAKFIEENEEFLVIMTEGTDEEVQQLIANLTGETL